MNYVSHFSVPAVMLALAVGCSAAEPSEYDGEGTEPTSVIDPSSGEPVALNYVEGAAPIVVVPPSHTKSLSDPGQDVTAGTRWDESCLTTDVNQVISTLGGRVDSGGNFTTLRAIARTSFPDGTLGNPKEYRGGSDPNNSLEAWCSAPTNYAIIGVEGRVSGSNLTTLRVFSRHYNPATRRLEGNIFTTKCGTAPDNVAELRIVSWENIPDVYDSAVVSSFCMRAGNDNLSGMKLTYRNFE